MTDRSSPIPVELLHIPECPNFDAYYPHLVALLSDYNMPTSLTATLIESGEVAIARHFRGSPTVRVSGIDIDPTSTSDDQAGMQCRLYLTPNGLVGLPPDEWLLLALDRESTTPTTDRHDAR
jgi:hypothetical protein